MRIHLVLSLASAFIIGLVGYFGRHDGARWPMTMVIMIGLGFVALAMARLRGSERTDAADSADPLDDYRVRPGFWFRPKTFGWGAVPVTWQGWAATLVFVAAAAGIANIAQHRSAIWLVLLVPVILAFIWLCWSKTDGSWGGE